MRGTARSPDDEKKVGHLLRMHNADTHLTLVKADLLDEASCQEACVDADYVMHTASPFSLSVKDPQQDLVEPALQGTRYSLPFSHPPPNTVLTIVPF